MKTQPMSGQKETAVAALRASRVFIVIRFPALTGRATICRPSGPDDRLRSNLTLLRV